MLVDSATGASVSAIKAGIATQLGLKSHGITKIATPSDGAHQCPLYDIDILFPVHQLVTKNVRVIESAFEGQNIDGLIGRDILKLGLMVYTDRVKKVAHVDGLQIPSNLLTRSLITE